ncbi:MAG: hypothetical protein R3F17_17320 [Planctomycetota bacterium]
MNHFSVPSAYALAHQSADLLSATWNSSERNHFSDSSASPAPPQRHPLAQRRAEHRSQRPALLLGTMLDGPA